MSGGKWRYLSSQIQWVADDLQEIIDRHEAGLDNWVSPGVIVKFKDAAQVLTRAAIYEHRLDWLLSGDDGQESFCHNLAKELEAVGDPIAERDEEIRRLNAALDAVEGRETMLRAAIFAHRLHTKNPTSWADTRLWAVLGDSEKKD